MHEHKHDTAQTFCSCKFFEYACAHAHRFIQKRYIRAHFPRPIPNTLTHAQMHTYTTLRRQSSLTKVLNTHTRACTHTHIDNTRRRTDTYKRHLTNKLLLQKLRTCACRNTHDTAPTNTLPLRSFGHEHAHAHARTYKHDTRIHDTAQKKCSCTKSKH